jgi:hypothetical protein
MMDQNQVGGHGSDYVGLPRQAAAWFFAGRAARNGCAQAAVAWLIDFHGGARNPYPAGTDLAAAVYRDHPPDTPLALFGTTPGRVERICRAYGFATRRSCERAGGGPERLRGALDGGRPVIALLDLRRLGGEWGLHYAVVYGCDDAAVHCTNMPPTRHSAEPRQAIAWSGFTRAWRCWIPWPGFQCMGIEAW